MCKFSDARRKIPGEHGEVTFNNACKFSDAMPEEKFLILFYLFFIYISLDIVQYLQHFYCALHNYVHHLNTIITL